MEVHVPIFFLLFASVIGVAVSDDDLTLHNSGKLAKRSLILGALVERKIIDYEFPKLISFTLYTRNTTKSPEKLKVGDVNGLNSSHFNTENPTVFVTHGWTQSCGDESCTLIRDAYLQNGDYNIILVDWSLLSKFEYLWISQHIADVAKQVSRMIDFLASQGMDPSQLTSIGHSLGAHIAGLASYYADNKANYIVALDPAGPNFHLKDQKSRVSKGDGNYVEVIHTTHFTGLISPIGDADFYPNGAKTRRGCDEGCSHGVSYKYFAESINNDSFLAVSCDNFDNYEKGKCDSNPTALMGGVTPDPDATGKFFLTTNPNSPYAKNSA